MEKPKKRWGDRPDATLVRDIDGMHMVTPLIYPNRADNEAFISEQIDLTKTDEYIDRKNAENPEFTYKLFHIVVAAIMKTIVLRPKLNRFYANKNLYMRDEINCGFVIKKEFKDESREGLAFLKTDENSTLETVRTDIYNQIHRVRVVEADNSNTKGRKASTDDFMEMFPKMPRFFVKFLFWIFRFLDRHGWIPYSLIATDPDYSSVFISNLGSIGLHAGYHHLSNWATTSLFVVIGEKKQRMYPDGNGGVLMKDSVDLGITIDERIADGYYYAKSVKIIKKLIENPELLEKPFGEAVEV